MFKLITVLLLQLLLDGVGRGGGTGAPLDGTFTLIQSPANTACSGTTCAITLTQTTAVNNLLVFCSISQDRVQIQSVDKGGTAATIPSSYMYNDINGASQCSWILPSGSSAATTPITVTFSASVNGWGGVRLLEFHPSANFANVGLDNAGAIVGNGTSTVGPTFTFSGTHDTEVQMCASVQNCTAINSPYSNNVTFASGWGWAADPAATGTAPTWTINPSSTLNQIVGAAFGFNISSCSDQSFIDFEASTSGTTTTEALLRTSTHGWNGGVWAVGGTGTAMKFQSASSYPLLHGTSRLCGDGVTYAAGVGSLGVRLVGDGTTNTSYLQYTMGMGPTNTSISVLMSFWSDLIATDASNYDLLTIYGTGTDFINVKDKTNGTGMSRRFESESPGDAAGAVDHSSSTQYWLFVKFVQSGNHEIKVFDATGAQVGTTITAVANGELPARIFFGKSNANTVTNGKNTDFDSLRISLTGEEMVP